MRWCIWQKREDRPATVCPRSHERRSEDKEEVQKAYAGRVVCQEPRHQKIFPNQLSRSNIRVLCSSIQDVACVAAGVVNLNAGCGDAATQGEIKRRVWDKSFQWEGRTAAPRFGPVAAVTDFVSF